MAESEADMDNTIKLGKMNNDILRSLECPSCLDIMCSAIYVCMTGHSICETCWSSLTNCPICGEELAATRNYTLEAVVMSVCYPCENREFGCNRFFSAVDLSAHTKICRYKIYKCKILPDSCTYEGRLDDLQKHIYQAHPLYVAQGAINCFVWRSDQQPETSTQLIALQKEQFYIYRFMKNDIMYWIAQYLGNSEDEGVDSSFKLSIKKGPKQDRRFFVMSENCIDNSVEDIEAVIETGHCIGIPANILNSYKVQNVLRYQIELRMAE